MNKLIHFFILLTLPFAISCSSYVNKFHKMFDAEETAYARPGKDHFNVYKNKKHTSKIADNYRVSSKNTNQMSPTTKRQYLPKKTHRRYTADDLTDNQNSESLWAGQGRDNYLFSNKKEVKTGDIILINVRAKLKNEITMELKRNFPDRPKPRPKTAEGATAPAPAAPPAASGDSDKVSGNQVYDRISGVIIEEINDDHVLLRGRKHVLFKNIKHLIEVQLLVPRRDINKDDDSIDSDRSLESSVLVLR